MLERRLTFNLRYQISEFSKIESRLTGWRGILYYLFVGRQVIAGRIVRKLRDLEQNLLALQSGSVEHALKIIGEDSVYVYVNDLENHDIIHCVRKEKGRGGVHKYRTANPDILFKTLDLYWSDQEEPVAGGGLPKEDKTNFQVIFKNIGGIVDCFPFYLWLYNKQGSVNYTWTDATRYFLDFCCQLITACHGLEGELESKEEGSNSPSDTRWMKEVVNSPLLGWEVFMSKALRTGCLSSQNISALGSLSEGDSIYEDSFLRRLKFTSIGLVDPQNLAFIRLFLETGKAYGRSNLLHCFKPIKDLTLGQIAEKYGSRTRLHELLDSLTEEESEADIVN